MRLYWPKTRPAKTHGRSGNIAQQNGLQRTLLIFIRFVSCFVWSNFSAHIAKRQVRALYRPNNTLRRSILNCRIPATRHSRRNKKNPRNHFYFFFFLRREWKSNCLFFFSFKNVDFIFDPLKNNVNSMKYNPLFQNPLFLSATRNTNYKRFVKYYTEKGNFDIQTLPADFP